MDSRICQTFTASPAKPGDLPWRLAELIQSLGYVPKGEPVFAAYNDPFSFPLLKRNEILIEVE